MAKSPSVRPGKNGTVRTSRKPRWMKERTSAKAAPVTVRFVEPKKVK